MSIITGTDGNDYILEGPDSLIEDFRKTVNYGFGGNEIFVNSGENDSLDGAAGNDIYMFNDLSGLYTITDKLGNNTVDFSGITDNLTINLSSGKIGPSEFLVNSNPDKQDPTYMPMVTPLSNGTYMVIWESGLAGIQYNARIYDATGNPVGTEFTVVSSTGSKVDNPNIIALSDNKFLFLYEMFPDQSYSPTQGATVPGPELFGHFYDSTGNPIGQAFPLNLYSPTKTFALNNGKFIVFSQDDHTDLLYGTIFDSNGKVVGNSFPINTSSNYWDTRAVSSFSNLSDGGFIITWNFSNSGNNPNATIPSGLLAQRYDASGNPVGSEFRISTSLNDQGARTSAVTALPNSGFFVVWNDDPTAVKLQKYDAFNHPVGPQIQLYSNPSNASGDMNFISTIPLQNNHFLVTWNTWDTANFLAMPRPSVGQELGQILDGQGNPIGQSFEIATFHGDYNAGLGTGAGIMPLSDGGFMATWTEDAPAGYESYKIIAQRFDASGTHSDPTNTVVNIQGNIANAIGGTGNDLLIGTASDNTLQGNAGNDTLIGDAGNDTLIGGSGNDLLSGGSGNDQYVFKDGWGNDTIDDAQGNHTIDFQAVTKDLQINLATAQASDGTNTVQLPVSGQQDIICGSGNDLVTDIEAPNGPIRNEVVWGKAGNDTLITGSGNDVLVGGAGNDLLQGGAGNDVYLFYSGSGNDTIQESSGWDQLIFLNGATEKTVVLYGDNNSNDLHIGYTNSTDEITVKDQAGAGWIEHFELPDGKYLSGGNINTIVQDMNAYANTHHIQITSLNDVKNNPDLMGIISAAWHP